MTTHEEEQILDELHKKGPGCLTRHQWRMNSDHRCSHIDQARIKAEADGNTFDAAKDIYKFPRYKSICATPGEATFKSAARKTKKYLVFPPNYAKKEEDGSFSKARPNPGDWDPGTHNFAKRFKNFTHFTEPYWHNSHHIVPNSVLAREIADAAKKDGRLSYLIKSGLLEAGYNLNAKVNVMILPMEMAVATALMLPRHLVGGEVGPNEKKEYFSHKDYSNKIAAKVKAVMDDYADILTKDPPEEHSGKPSEMSKAKLETISKTVYEQLVNIKPKFNGKPLSDLDLE